MKLGLLTNAYYDRSFEETLDRAQELGLEAVEVGTGNYVGSDHCDLDALLADQAQAGRFRDAVAARGMAISALSQHGNPLHPDDDVARHFHETWRKTVQLASVLEVPVVNALSGCPGDGPGARFPNWVTCAFAEFPDLLEWQWAERVLPYWATETRFAAVHGVSIGFEMHPGCVVYNPPSLLRLRAETGPAASANVDPSHLVWQGIDPVEAIAELGSAGAIVHAHAKDTRIDETNARRNGVLDTKPLEQTFERSWTFRTVGDGGDPHLWPGIVGALRAIGYDGVLSIEHEDPLVDPDTGVTRTIGFLRGIVSP